MFHRPLSFVFTLALILVAIGLAACERPAEPQFATLAITGARVWTGDADQPWAEAIASRGENIIAVGSNAEIETMIDDDTTVISVPGSMLVPGFIDTHVHFIDGGASLASVQLRDAATPEEFTQRIGDYAKTIDAGEWILDGAWDHENWGGELPRRDWIDDVTPDNPVWVYRLDGHMALANSSALKLAGVDADSGDIAGGEIVRDEAGSPTGILKEAVPTTFDFKGMFSFDTAKQAQAFITKNKLGGPHSNIDGDLIGVYSMLRGR